jgi:hypothetical protein
MNLNHIQWNYYLYKLITTWLSGNLLWPNLFSTGVYLSSNTFVKVRKSINNSNLKKNRLFFWTSINAPSKSLITLFNDKKHQNNLSLINTQETQSFNNKYIYHKSLQESHYTTRKIVWYLKGSVLTWVYPTVRTLKKVNRLYSNKKIHRGSIWNVSLRRAGVLPLVKLPSSYRRTVTFSKIVNLRGLALLSKEEVSVIIEMLNCCRNKFNLNRDIALLIDHQPKIRIKLYIL